ncbi:MAG: hypothetical protein MMC23_009398 [Stictis urceolatum]|nr:hypothetical protein [Stictis urceolata]
MSAALNTSLASADHFVPNETRGPVVLAVTLWTLGFSTIFVVLRCISRLGIVKRWSWDDSSVVVAWFLAFGFSFSICWGVRNGLGRHEEYIRPENEVALRKSEYAFSVLYNPVLMATKTSILTFYLTLSKNQPIFKWASIATLVVVNVAGLALTILNVFQCRPVGAVFHQVIPANAQCTDLVTIYLSSSPVNIVTDLAILVLPFPVLTKMRLPKKQKIILIVTFSFGFFVAAVDIVRIAYLQQAFQVRLNEVGRANANISNISQGDDFSWYASLSFMWSAIEVHVGIICACVPSLKPLVARVLPSMLRDLTNPHDNSVFRQSSNGRHLDSPANAGHSSPRSPRSPIRPQIRQTPSETILRETAIADESEEPSRHPSRDGPQQGPEEGPHMNGTANTAEREMNMVDFLTTPDMNSPREIRRTPTANTHVSSTTNRDNRRGSITFYDFYNIESKKPMTRLSNRQSFAPLAVVTFLFFMWGFAYGLLDVLNEQFAMVTRMSSSQSSGLHAAYFAAYFIGPPTIGQLILLKLGFKATFMVGLCIYGVGTLIFWPSAVLGSFPAFIICNFVVGLGISVIETGANPFVALCGPPQHAESRLNISQGLQAIGTVVSPLLAKKVFFKAVRDGASLINVQWAYLGIAFFDVLLAVVFFYIPLPEASDEDFERVAEKRSSINSASFFRGKSKIKVVYTTLALGVFSQFCYVSAQEGAAQLYQTFAQSVDPSSPVDPFTWQTIGHAVFAFGRFVCAGAGFLIAPRNVLLILFLGMIVTSALMIHVTGPAGVAMITLYEFFQSGVFSLIYAIALRGLGGYTKRGSVWLTAAIGGGMVGPLIINPVSEDRGVRVAVGVSLAFSAAGAIFPVYLSAVGRARRQVDPVYEKRSGLPVAEAEGQAEGEDRAGGKEKRGWLGRRKRASREGMVEHVEEKEEEEEEERKGSITT